jgi:hypothetical protein
VPDPQTDAGTLQADTEVIAGFGRVAAGLAEQIEQAALQTRMTDPTGLTPLLGAVGTDFLAAFTAAYDGHTRELDRIREVLSGMGTAATLTAAAYERTVSETADALRGAAERLEATP